MSAQIIVSRSIEASAERLFDAWLDPASLAQWMRRDDSEPSDATVDPRVGGAFSVTMHGSQGAVVHSGSYTVIDRPRLLEFTWRSPVTHQIDSVVRVSFGADGDGTLVEVRHELLPDAEAATKHTKEWTEILARLAGRLSRPAALAVASAQLDNEGEQR